MKYNLIDNKFFNIGYKLRFYLNLGITQISWFTSKFVDIMAILYLLDKFGIEPTNKQLTILAVIVTVLLTVFGFVWKKIGFYDIEMYVNAHRNPVQDEMLKAARLINKKYGDK